jgi:hypothetical protein
VPTFSPGAVVQLIGDGKETADACSQIFNGTPHIYHKEDRPWVVIDRCSDPEIVPCGKTATLISPVGHDHREHGGRSSVELDPGTIPPSVYGQNGSEHYVVHTVCAVVATNQLRRHTIGGRPVSLNTIALKPLWDEVKLEHHSAWNDEARRRLYAAWCKHITNRSLKKSNRGG